MNLDAWLKMLADEGGSDLYLTTGAPPQCQISGGVEATVRRTPFTRIHS